MTIEVLLEKVKNLYRFDMTQLGMAERFISDHGSSVRHCAAWGKWLVWNGKQWAIDDDADSNIHRRAHVTIRRLRDEARQLLEAAKNITDDQLKQDLEEAVATVIKHAIGCERFNELNAVLKHAATLANVQITPDKLDAHPMLLNCQNGVIDLASGEFIPHTDQRVKMWLLTKIIPVEYHPDAACPRWERVLQDVFCGDAEVIAYVQKCVGYMLTGDVSEKALWLFIGGGNNGKSTFLKILERMLGDYAGVIDLDTLMKDRSDDYSLRMIATMHGKRLVRASETSEGCRINEALIKRLTGMDTLVGRPIFGKSFMFPPEFKLFIDANHRPEVRGTDNAIWLRMRVVPFLARFSSDPAEVDAGALPIEADIEAKLMEELAGILAWAVRGAVSWRSDGLPTPASIVAAVADYRADQDMVSKFLADCTVAEGTVHTKTLYTAFSTWLKATGERDIPKQRWLTERVKERYKIGGHDRKGDYFTGIRLRSEHCIDLGAVNLNDLEPEPVPAKPTPTPAAAPTALEVLQ